MRKKVLFICIEGSDKSGKTTQAFLLVKDLCNSGFNAVYTTEPSEGEIGQFIRRYVLSRKKRLPVVIEALLFAADRVDHNEREIKSLLNEGKIVVSDRYLFSSLAYQGAAGLDIKWILEINKSVLTPDLTIYLDVPVDVIFKRCKHEKSIMEHPEIQKKVLEVYRRLVSEGKMFPIDGNRPMEEVANDIKALVLRRLKDQSARI